MVVKWILENFTLVEILNYVDSLKISTLNDFVWNVTDVVNVKHELQSIDNENLGLYTIIFLKLDSKFVIFDGKNIKLQTY